VADGLQQAHSVTPVRGLAGAGKIFGVEPECPADGGVQSAGKVTQRAGPHELSDGQAVVSLVGQRSLEESAANTELAQVR